MSSKIIDPLSLDESAGDSENTLSVSVWEHGARSQPQIPLKVLKGHAGGLTSCHFCFNDTKMLTSSQDKTAIIWDADSCSKQRVFEGGHQSTISECALVPGKNSIITVSWDKSMICWDVETGQRLWQSSHAGLLTSCSVSADEKLVVCAADTENALYISDANTGQKIHHITDHHRSIVTRCRFDSQGQHVASVSADRTVRLWDLLAQKTTISINSNHSNVVSNCCFTSGGRLLCTASWDKTLRLWDVQTGGFRSGGGLTLSKGHAGCVSSCCFSSDDRLLVSGSYDRTAILWDMNTHCHTLTLKGHGDWVTDVSISTDRKWVASASKDCTVRLWNIECSEEIPEIIEKRRDQGMGFHVIKCEECGKPFSVSRLETTDLLTNKLSGSSGVSGEDAQSAMERLVDARMGAARAEILAGLERRVESAEEQCEDKTGELRRQCQRERGEGRRKMEEELSGSTSHLRRDLASMQAQIHGVEAADSCCGRTSGLDERVSLLEQSVSGLNQSQLHLAKELGGHKDHMDGMVAGRLEYIEAMLNLTETTETSGGAPGGLEAHLDGKLRVLESRMLMAVEELVAGGGNATTLEGHAVMPTDLESLRGRLEMDVERVQKHLSDLEARCLAHSASDVQGDAGVSGEVDENARMALDAHAVRLNSLNATLQALLNQRALRGLPEGQEGGPSVQGELTILRFDLQSVNTSLTGLAGSVGTVAQHMDRVNNTWTEREGRLAHQMRGVVQLVGRQASMLGAGDRRLNRLKAELAGMKRRLAGELQGCRTTALGVLQEVEEVGGRVSSVEDQCKGLKDMETHLERVRVELEGQADSLLLLVNGTLSSHAQQLSELRTGLLSCGANNNNNNDNNDDNGTTTRPEPEPILDISVILPTCTDGGTTGPAPEPCTQDTVLPLNGTTGGTSGPEPTQDTVLPLNGTTAGTSGPEPTQDTVLPLNGTTGGTSGPEPTQDTVLPLNGTTGGTSGPEPTQDTVLPLNGTTGTSGPEPTQDTVLPLNGTTGGTSGPEPTQDTVLPLNGTTGTSGPEPTQDTVLPLNGTTGTSGPEPTQNTVPRLNGTTGTTEPEPIQNPEVYGVLDGSIVQPNGTIQNPVVPLNSTTNGTSGQAEPEPIQKNPAVVYGLLDGSVVPMNGTTTTGPEPELTLNGTTGGTTTTTGPAEPAESIQNPVVLYGVLDGSVVPTGQPTQQDTAVPPPPPETRGDTFTLI